MSYKRADSREATGGPRARGAAWLGLPLALVVASLAFTACGTERPLSATDDEKTPGSGDACATPNEGCDCLEPGKKVECGTVKATSDDGYVACSMGQRQCIGGRWGACIGENDVVKPRSLVAAGGPIGTRALGTGAPCGAPGGGPANPCDPYCNAFVDDPLGLTLDGGLAVIDGGLGVAQQDAAAADGGTPGGYSTTAGGISNCGGATNIVAASCTPPGLGQCQQDHHCDTLTNKCLWNGTAGYFDPNAGGVDLTVGVPCGPGGSVPSVAMVCNRGSVSVPMGSPIKLERTNAAQPDGCTTLAPLETFNFTLTANLVPGACASFNIPDNSTGNKYITVNAGAGGAPVAEAPGRCANNSAAWKTDGSPGCSACVTCNTTLTGKVYDPSGVSPATNANNLPLSGVTVYQPAGALRTLTDGVQCDNCTNLSSPAQTETVTDANGAFTLTNVSPGTAVPIVVQSGRWRRAVTVNVPACTTTAVANGTLRMPKNRTDGLNGVANIPKTALAMGGAESLECWLRRVGIDAAEMRPRTGPGDANRIQLYRASNASNYAVNTSPASPSVSTLYAAGGPLNEYASLILPCDGGEAYDTTMYNSSAADRARIRDYANLGGRIFADHWPGQVFLRNGPAPFNGAAVSTWQNSGATASPTQAKVLTTGGPQTTFRNWLGNVGASTDYGTGWVRVDTARKDSITVGSASTEWLRGQSSNNWGGQPGGDYSVSFSFETPVGAAAGATCGRVLFNDMHVSIGRVNGVANYPIPGSKTFPTDCSLGAALSAEEKALEFQFFQLTACQLGGSTPPPPPAPPPPLPVVTYQRDYQAVCGPGERVKWGPFYWQSTIPALTSIEFRAATAASIAALPASPPAAAPTTALVANNTSTTTPAGAWDCNGCPGAPVTVDSQLVTQTSTPSKDFLRIFMKFTPTGLISPVLGSWRQVYDCVPAE